MFLELHRWISVYSFALFQEACNSAARFFIVAYTSYGVIHGPLGATKGEMGPAPYGHAAQYGEYLMETEDAVLATLGKYLGDVVSNA